jgi:hypothetical protein
LNKKGSFGDVIYLIVALCVIAIIFVVCWKLLSTINAQAQGGNLISTEGKTMMQSLTSRFVGINDAAFLLIFVGLLIGTGAGAYFIYTHPAMVWISIPIMVFIVFLSAIFANAMYPIFHSQEFLSEYQSFPVISFVFDNFVFVMVGVVLLISLLLFIKPSSVEPQ